MAADKKKATDVTEPTNGVSDISAYLPEGISLADLEDTGGLTPIYAPKEAWGGKFPKVMGKIDKIMVLPAVQQGKETYTPIMVLVRELAIATKGIQGPKSDRKIVDAPVGKEILIPLTGNLQSNRQLIEAATDPKHYYFATFEVKGYQPVANQPSDMAVWEVKIARGKPFVRAGAFLHSAPNAPQLGVAAGGHLYNSQTGEVADKPLVAAAAS